MDSQTKLLFSVMIGLGLLVVAIFLQPTIEEELAPDLVTAWVAIEVEGREAAEVGRVEIEAGTPFRLHAVVEAAGRRGPVYYTEAPALVIDGQKVDSGRLRQWNRPLDPRVRWFTVEGSPPFVEIGSESDLERFRFTELYRSDWPLAWSVPGEIDPAQDDHLADDSPLGRREFGILRYSVSVELYDKVDELRPKKNARSWGGEDLERETARFPTVVQSLPGLLASASRVFGLTQLEVRAGDASAQSALLARVDEMAGRALAYSRVTVLRDHLRSAGKSLSELVWGDVDLLAAEARWGADASPGDLLRVGERFVVLYQDREPTGRLDYEDLCFDYVRGAAVRRLGDVFSGAGVVELARLGATSSPSS